VIIMAYVMMSDEEAAAHRPRVVLVGEGNTIKRALHYGDAL
jgi:aspartate 1-decarboxylase